MRENRIDLWRAARPVTGVSEQLDRFLGPEGQVLLAHFTQAVDEAQAEIVQRRVDTRGQEEVVRAWSLFDDGRQQVEKPRVCHDLEVVEHDRGGDGAGELEEQGVPVRRAGSRRAIGRRQQAVAKGTTGGRDRQPQVASEPAGVVVLGPEREPYDPIATARLGPLSQQHCLAVARRGHDHRQPLPLAAFEKCKETLSAEGADRQRGSRRGPTRRAARRRACARRSHIAPSSRERPAIPQPR